MFGQYQNITSEDSSKVFIGGLSINCTDIELKMYLEQFGEVVSCGIIKDRLGNSRGYGFASFSSPRSVQRAIGKHHFLKEKVFEIRPQVDSEQNQEHLNEIARRKVFVSNLKQLIHEDDLYKYFSSYGSIQDILISKDPATQISKGFGFIVFYEPESVYRLLGSLSKRSLRIKNQDVYVKEAIPKKDILKLKKRQKETMDDRPEEYLQEAEYKYYQDHQYGKSHNDMRSKKPNEIREAKRMKPIAVNTYEEEYERLDYNYNGCQDFEDCTSPQHCYEGAVSTAEGSPVDVLSSPRVTEGLGHARKKKTGLAFFNNNYYDENDNYDQKDFVRKNEARNDQMLNNHLNMQDRSARCGPTHPLQCYKEIDANQYELQQLNEYKTVSELAKMDFLVSPAVVLKLQMNPFHAAKDLFVKESPLPLTTLARNEYGWNGRDCRAGTATSKGKEFQLFRKSSSCCANYSFLRMTCGSRRFASRC